MASDIEFVRFVCEQLRGAGEISSRRMFGEAAIYLDEKVVALVCDNQLFLKKTEAGRALIGVPTEAPPFAGASDWFLLADLDDPEFLAVLARATAEALPLPKIKKPRAPRKPIAVVKKKVLKKAPKNAARKK
jgi:TfoX/Sxy family transcriptional regulator of competence genes